MNFNKMKYWLLKKRRSELFLSSLSLFSFAFPLWRGKEIKKKEETKRNQLNPQKHKENTNGSLWFILRWRKENVFCCWLFIIKKSLFLFDKTQIPFYLFISKWMKIKKNKMMVKKENRTQIGILMGCETQKCNVRSRFRWFT